jgi:diguanylate cyclase (GGDEF)-like protein
MSLTLTHVERITRERDRPQLNIALAEALRDLLGISRVSIHGLLQTPGETFVWPTAVADDTGSHIHDDGFSIPADMVSIDYYPLLDACLQTCTRLADGDSTIFPILRTNGRPCGFVAIVGKPLSAAQLAIAEHLLAIYANMLSLLDYSEIDTLTGLLNRKTFDHYLMRILRNFAGGDDNRVKTLHMPRRRSQHSLLMDHWLGVLDVDHFKNVNDKFGHSIGDEMLLLISTMMKASFRAHDKLFRFGGEEFVILLKPTEEGNAHGAFERFRQKIEAFEFPQAGRITVSIGYVRIGFDDQPSVILEHADAALYWAKEHGRNQVANYGALVGSGALVAKEKVSDVEFF